MAGKLIGIMFLSRDVAHREHLKTKGDGSFSKHSALDMFYHKIVDIADKLGETWQGRHGIIKDIPRMNDAPQGAIDTVLETHLKTIEKNRFYDADKDDTAIQNIIDEIVGLYLTTLYKLRNLK